MNKLILNIVLLTVSALLLFSCAANKAVSNVSYDKNMMNHADSIFTKGNYEKAKQEYKSITLEGKSKMAKALAQFKLGYLNVYYENPFADYSVALHEFEKFVRIYPSHTKAGEANNYIRILDRMNKVNDVSKKNKQLVSGLSDKHEDLVNNLIGMQKAYLKSNRQVDSLKNRIRVLEAVIEEVDKIK